MTEPKLKPIAPADVDMRTDRSGEKYAWDKVNSRILSTGFDDEDDFEDWKKQFFERPANFSSK